MRALREVHWVCDGKTEEGLLAPWSPGFLVLGGSAGAQSESRRMRSNKQTRGKESIPV